MLISLLVCTMNRELLLDRCLKSLVRQSYDNFEVIIIDQSDKKLESYSCYLFESIKYLHISKKGLSNARNVGLEYVNGDYVCLIDDDAIYPDNWLEKVVQSLKDNPVSVLCGRTRGLLSGEYGLSGKCDNVIETVSFWKVMSYGISPCLVFETKILKRFGFDDRFGVGREWGAGEETDVIWNILEDGGEMRYEPQILVYHPVISKVKISTDKLASYNLGFGALFAKHWYEKNNFKAFIYFLYSISRNIVGFFLYTFKNDISNKMIQIISFKSKCYGFKCFRNSFRRI